MKVILYMAMSINGYIATEDGNEDFLSHENWDTFCKLAPECGAFIVGRKTYEAVQSWTEGYTYDDVDAIRIVVSRNKSYEIGSSYLLATSPENALDICKQKGLNEVILTGGSSLNSEFMRRNLVDEIIVNIEPFVLGKGIKIFADNDWETELELINIKELPSKIVQLCYKVKKN